MANLSLDALLGEWRRFLHGHRVQDIAISYEDARQMVGRRAEWFADASLQTFVEPRIDFSLLGTPANFSAVFPWFPEDFPWEDATGRLAFGLKGGAAAHMFHGQGFNDLDMYMFELPNGGSNVRHSPEQFLRSAVQCITETCEQSVVIQNPNTVSIFLKDVDGNVQCVQFVLHVHTSLSEAILCSDLDVTQVMYRGGRGAETGLYLSILAVQAYVTGYLNIRSGLNDTKIKRIIKYSRRGFGIRVGPEVARGSAARVLREALDQDDEGPPDHGNTAAQVTVRRFHDSLQRPRHGLQYVPVDVIAQLWQDSALGVRISRSEVLCHARCYACQLSQRPLDIFIPGLGHKQIFIHQWAPHVDHLSFRMTAWGDARPMALPP